MRCIPQTKHPKRCACKLGGCVCRGGVWGSTYRVPRILPTALELVSGNAVVYFSGSAACLIANLKANARQGRLIWIIEAGRQPYNRRKKYSWGGINPKWCNGRQSSRWRGGVEVATITKMASFASWIGWVAQPSGVGNTQLIKSRIRLYY